MNFEKYKNVIEYPRKPFIRYNASGEPFSVHAKDIADWEKRIESYKQARDQLVENFKNDAFVELGITANEKRDMLFETAWDNYCDNGFEGVFGTMQDLVELIE